MSLYVDIEKKLGTFFLRAKFEAADETIALLGASGSGKSLTLRCIAGIEKPDRGRIILDGRTLFDSEQGINLPPQERRIGLMLQDYALFPNMTVHDNIRAGARREKDKRKRAATVEEMMHRFGIEDLAKHMPSQLSGGQRQRVALARMLVSAPQLLLLDEPFSALDRHLRFLVENELRQIIRSFGRTVVLVSHDCGEVYRMSSRTAVIENGSVTACGNTAAVFASPKTRTCARLTGCEFISAAEMRTPNRVFAKDWGLELQIPETDRQIVSLGLRARDVCIGGGENSFLCSVTEEIENPFSNMIMLRPEGTHNRVPFGMELSREKWNEIRASQLRIRIPKDAILLLED